MIEINLIPDVKQELIKAQRTRSTVISLSILISIIALSIVALLSIYIFAVQSIRSLNDDNLIKTKSDTLMKIPDLSKTLTIQNQLTKISSLNNNKKVDSRVFDVLLAIIPPAPNDIKISDLSINSDTNTIVINGQALNSYPAVEIFKKTIDSAKLKYVDSNNISQEIALASNVVISDTSYGETSSGSKVLRFTASFEYVPELFSPISKNTTIIISMNGNVTDSYLGVPKNIFIDRAADISGAN